MKKSIIFIITITLGIFLIINNANALVLDGQAPVTSNAAINAEIIANWDGVLAEANQQVAKYGNMTKMANSFANANTYAANTAALWGYQGYDKIAIMVGVAAGVHLPTLAYNQIEEEMNKIETEGDAETGVAPAAALNIGICWGWMNKKLRDFYINVKFFKYAHKFNYGGYELNFDTMNIGFGFNYQIFRAKSIAKGFIRWRGLSIGTGFSYQQSVIDYIIDLDDVSSDFAVNVPPLINMTMLIDPSVKLITEMKTYTIPIEVMTSVRLFYVLNITAGAGVDFCFGNSSVTVSPHGDVTLDGLPGGVTVIEPGYISGSEKTKGEPTKVHPKLMAGVGINIGPVALFDVQLTYYMPSAAMITFGVGFSW